MAQVEMPKSSIGQKPEQPKKKFEKVVKGKVTVKEQNDIQKIANDFLAEDLKTVKDRIVMEYLGPDGQKRPVEHLQLGDQHCTLGRRPLPRKFGWIFRLCIPAEQL